MKEETKGEVKTLFTLDLPINLPQTMMLWEDVNGNFSAVGPQYMDVTNKHVVYPYDYLLPLKDEKP